MFNQFKFSLIFSVNKKIRCCWVELLLYWTAYGGSDGQTTLATEVPALCYAAIRPGSHRVGLLWSRVGCPLRPRNHDFMSVYFSQGEGPPPPPPPPPQKKIIIKGQIQGDVRKFLERFKSYFGSQISRSLKKRSLSTDYSQNLQQKVIFFLIYVFDCFESRIANGERSRRNAVR